jgi:hypothetical protein
VFWYLLGGLVVFVVMLVPPVALCLLVAWLLIKHPIASILIATYIGLVMWLGAHDAQALVIYAVIALAIWRLVHKRSFQLLVDRRPRSPYDQLGGYHAPPAPDHRAIRPLQTPPAAPTRAEDPTE